MLENCTITQPARQSKGGTLPPLPLNTYYALLHTYLWPQWRQLIGLAFLLLAGIVLQQGNRIIVDSSALQYDFFEPMIIR